MRRMPLIGVLTLAVAGTYTSASEPAEGTIQIDSARVEVLSRKIPIGQRIELPEGWYRVEEEGVEDEQTGSFTVMAARTPSAEAVVAEPAPETEPSPPPSASPQEAAPPCRAERSAYLKTLWRESGIDVPDPDAVIEGLDAGSSGPGTAYGWFALQVDPFRSLAWSSELRGRASDLARCVREARREVARAQR